MPERLALAEQVEHPPVVAQLDRAGAHHPHRVGRPLALAEDRRRRPRSTRSRPAPPAARAPPARARRTDRARFRNSAMSCMRGARSLRPRPRSDQPGEDVLGAADVGADQRRRRASASPARRWATSSRCWALERVSTSSGWAMQRDQVAHLALDLGHLGDQARRAGGLGDADVEADVGAPVVLEVGRRRPSARPARRARRGRRGSARSAASIAEPTSIATRWSSTAQASPPSGSSSRSASGGRSATKVPPVRPRTEFRWPGLDQGRQRLAQGRARDPQLLGELALGRQLAARGQQADADRRPEPLDRLLERGRRPHRLEHRLDGGIALHRPTVAPPRSVPSGVGRPSSRAPRGSRRSPARCRESGRRSSRSRARSRR